MSNSTYLSLNKPISSLCPTNGRQTVGDGAFYVDVAPSVLAICHVQGSDDMYYYSTTGGFDTPKSKCPPDRGSSGCVTGSPASKHATAYNHTLYPTPQSTPEDTRRDSRQNFSCPPLLPTTQADITAFPRGPIAPQPIPGASRSNGYSHGLATPPLTPDDSIEDVSIHSNDDAFELLTTLFPNHGIAALEYARSVSVSSLEMGISFDGVVLELPGKPKTFYVDCKSAEIVNLREGIVALLDLADEHLQCSALIIALEKASPALSNLLHALMYVGGTVVTKPDFPVDPAYVLVGLEI
ncbi:ornithine decarboxylase antizyme-domain-containing protein [Lactarius hengduanensis]|nr:ornithine decarboxylase antizyme-domain-containing protein [Lactarius hengduanensis]